MEDHRVANLARVKSKAEKKFGESHLRHHGEDARENVAVHQGTGVNNVPNGALDSPFDRPGVNTFDRTESEGRLAYFKHDTGHINLAFVDSDGYEDFDASIYEVCKLSTEAVRRQSVEAKLI
ncbi:hypothetical protein NQ318_016844 [Aromia moschata]|uniref:Uncharacterized protein n=1 Tax=Aromia moschata TaxID=1265417 RepID=A0AAV8YTQ0_9CUCU|nr:hypothetical protein NQ318_016844 [Aromia moschata]